MEYEGVIVLGYELDHGQLHDMAKKRIDKFLEFYRKKRSKVIFAGGYSIKIEEGVGPTEASLMKEYAMEHGVEEEDIILEEKSRDTHANAYFTKKIVEKLGWKKIVVVTTDVNVHKNKYYFEFIYGEGYEFEFVGVRREASEEERDYLMKYDKSSVGFMRKIYERKGVERGDDKKVKEIIDEFYADKKKGWNPKSVIKVS